MIQSRLDNDNYVFTMGQVIWAYWDYDVRYAFKNRSLGVRLGHTIDIDRLRESIEHVRTLRFSQEEIAFLQKQGIFTASYLKHLQKATLPEVDVRTDKEGWLYVEYEGRWVDAVMWETPLLALINEAHFSGARTEELWDEGKRRLDHKITVLREHPAIRFSDFGTRRRLCSNWHYTVLERIATELPGQIVGTSNPLMAQQFGLKPIGTLAHQLTMVLAAKYMRGMPDAHDPLAVAEQDVIRAWAQVFPYDMRIALTDTYTTKHFLANLPWEVARHLKGFRQDSGDPTTIGNLYLNWWREHGINPQERSIVFSDSLNLTRMISLERAFTGRVGSFSFGWGTDLTNDCGPAALNIVIKPSAVDGLKCVKLSDDLGKATGDPIEVQRYLEWTTRDSTRR